MAKGNLFLGTATGKLGDVVMYRRNGEQMSRPRIRHPRNPNTLAQQISRAVAASIQRLYSVGYAIYDHSFEGRKVGAGNQLDFLRANMRILRRKVIADINAGLTDYDCAGRVSAPGLSVACPFVGMQISAGSLTQTVFTFKADDGFEMPEPQSSSGTITENCGEYAARIGLVPGDIYTFVAMGSDPLQGTELAYYGDSETFSETAAVFQTLFSFAQLRVVEGVTELTDVLTASTPLSKFFEAGETGVDLTGLNIGSYITGQSVDIRMSSWVVGCIRSREDSGKRSNSFMYSREGELPPGLASNWLSEAWSRTSEGLDSDQLILDGSEFDPMSGGGGGGGAVTVTASFDFPAQCADLDGEELQFSRAVTEDEIVANLAFTVDGDGGGTVRVKMVASHLVLYQGVDEFNDLELSADGRTATFGQSLNGPELADVTWG